MTSHEPTVGSAKSAKSPDSPLFGTFGTGLATSAPHNRDLLDLVGGHTRLRFMCRTKGGEYAGACPFCGGRDRFRVWPEADRPGWWCRVCHRSGDAASFLHQVEGISYREACHRLRIEPGRRSSAPAPPAHNTSPPDAQWQRRGRLFVDLAHDCLLSAAGRAAREYLHHRRGLSDATIQRWQLGYNPDGGGRDAEEWGSVTTGRVWLSEGIVIPQEWNGTLWGIKIRKLTDAPRSRKYVQVEGSRRALVGSACTDDGQHASTVVVTEGEFDAMLLAQVAGDLAGVVTMGSAAGVPSTRWLWELRDARRFLVAYDSDFAGQSGAQVWAQRSQRVQVIRPVGGKDLTEMQQAGGDLRSWLVYHLRQAEERRAG